MSSLIISLFQRTTVLALVVAVVTYPCCAAAEDLGDKCRLEESSPCNGFASTFLYCLDLAERSESRALQSWSMSCDRRRDRNACFRAGRAFHDGGHGAATNIEVEHSCAALFYTRACDAGLDHGCEELRRLLRSTDTVAVAVDYQDGRAAHDSEDYAKAAEHWRRACSGGSAFSCGSLGYLYANGLGVKQDYSRAAALYKQGCDGGDAASCSYLGDRYLLGLGVEQDDSRAATLYKQGCDGGNAYSCGQLGLAYQNGQGVKQDYASAAALFKQGCDGGDAASCSYLGDRYLLGLGVEQDDSRAATLYKQGCDGGSAAGCNAAGYTIAINGGNLDEAESYVRKALEFEPGEPYALSSLAWIRYLQGKLAEAEDLTDKALAAGADGGEFFADSAAIYEGAGRMTEALQFYQRALEPIHNACEAGNKSACGRKQQIEAAVARLSGPPPDLVFKLAFNEPSGNGALDAGEAGMLAISLLNQGQGNATGVTVDVAGRAKGVAFSTPDKIEKLPAGQNTRLAIPLSASEDDLQDGKVILTITIHDALGYDPAPQAIEIPTRALIPPKLALAGIEIDDSDGNGNGRVEFNEQVTVTAIIQNQGLGNARDLAVRFAGTGVGLKILSVPIEKIAGLAPGESHATSIKFTVQRRYTGPEQLPLRLVVDEGRERFSFSAPLGVKLGERAEKPKLVRIKTNPGGGFMISEVAAELSLAGVPRAQQNDKTWAVVVGVERYRAISTPALYAASDAKTIRNYLEHIVGVPDDHIRLLIDDEATLVEFTDAIGGFLPRHVGEGDKVYFFFSGHGAPVPTDGAERSDEGVPHLVLYNSKPSSLGQTGYKISRLYSELGKLPAREVVVIMDSCFSGAGSRGTLPEGARPGLLRVKDEAYLPDNLSVLAASKVTQISNSWDEKEHGLFTYFFLLGLAGQAKDKNHDGLVDVADMFSYLEENIPVQARRISGLVQEPQVLGNRQAGIR